MQHFKNAEIRQASNVIRANVEVDSFVPITAQSPGNVEWRGVLRPPNNTGLALGEAYMLRPTGFRASEDSDHGRSRP